MSSNVLIWSRSETPNELGLQEHVEDMAKAQRRAEECGVKQSMTISACICSHALGLAQSTSC